MVNINPWSDDLPSDLLQSIADMLLVNLVDYIRFRAVCVSWRSSTVAPRHLKHPLPDQLPWVLPLTHRSIRPFHRLSDDKTVPISDEILLRSDRIAGTADGWLVVVDLTPGVRLVNPLTGSQIRLPPLAESQCRLLPDEDDDKVIIECSNVRGGKLTLNGWIISDILAKKFIFSEDHTVVVALIGFFNRIVFVSIIPRDRDRDAGDGGQNWTTINNLLPPMPMEDDETFVCWVDIVQHKGSFYAVDSIGRIASVCSSNLDASSSSSSLTYVTAAKTAAAAESQNSDWFLASSGEDLFLIVIDKVDHTKWKLQLFKLEQDSNSNIRSLIEVNSLGDDDRILFLGRNRSLCLSARDCPSPYDKPNTIYITGRHTGNNCNNPDDFALYSLEDGRFYPENHLDRQLKPAIWFTPTLC